MPGQENEGSITGVGQENKGRSDDTTERIPVMDYTEIENSYSKLTRLLIRKNLTITTMESVTAGEMASLITDTEGSSAIFKGAYITYSNEAKIQNGVPADIIRQYSVYSTETADAMAKACAAAFHADIGIGVTGTAGNVDPANPESSVPGQVCFSIYYQGSVHSYRKDIGALPKRRDYKMAVADEICTALINILAKA